MVASMLIDLIRSSNPTPNSMRPRRLESGRMEQQDGEYRQRIGDEPDVCGAHRREDSRMTRSDDAHGSHDAFDLDRFVRAQKDVYEQALQGIRSGYKRSHWMWHIFPQLAGLAFSQTSLHYAIRNADEAQAYLNHTILGPRLMECMESLLRLEGRSAAQIFGAPDDLKLRSCATLFGLVSSPGSPFERVLS